MTVGKYNGFVAEGYADVELLGRLSCIDELLVGPDAEDISVGRNRNVKLKIVRDDVPLTLAVKSFGRQSILQDRIAACRGSKARRTWLAAKFLESGDVGTPEPVGFLERWDGKRLVESYYLSVYQENILSFTGELVRLFRYDQDCGKLLSIMQTVADAVRKMHDAGFQHLDLGNQNILLRCTGDSEWSDVQFIDLNRGRIRDSLALAERARDISRIYLPSDLLRVFKEMYFGDTPPPAAFQREEGHCRRLYAWHSKSRNLRHPLLWIRSKATPSGSLADEVYPSEKDMWVWDEKSGQAVSVMRSKDKRKHYPLKRHWRTLIATLAGVLGVSREYKALLPTCYTESVKMKNSIGISISPKAETLERELGLLERLGRIPVFVRFYHHETEQAWAFAADVVKDLASRGHSVSVGLVQDRRAVIEPKKWGRFIDFVLDRVVQDVELVEVCHAINRVKWGIWSFDEYAYLLEQVVLAKERYPDMKLMGPAVIDFEYPFLMAALAHMPSELNFDVLSHHLYVDRRGQPENMQGPFDALKKFVLARAIARWSSRCDDRLIISEVNWPLNGTGAYSPVTSPYESPGPRFNDPSVSEDDYADYMLRYLVTAVCSGMVERVYWWRLTARGFGLVDDTESASWIERPAFGVLSHFVSFLGESIFIRKLPADAGVHFLLFERDNGETVCMGYSSVGDIEVEAPFKFSDIVDAFGCCEGGMKDDGIVRLSGRPVYFRMLVDASDKKCPQSCENENREEHDQVGSH
ncbi:MAG: hypothetical protein KAH23_08580 [Kiritimatiellae bacterium]|nr:hypothetical protein [Kiritimatiellia bacterium]